MIRKYWYGESINSLLDNEIFVFGSNPEGRHGKGAAKYAVDNFGAKYGIGRGIQGKSYGLVTKNLTPNFKEYQTNIVYKKFGNKSISLDMISENIKELYNYAIENPENNFIIPYRLDSENLNGYTGYEIAKCFCQDNVPINIIFHESYIDIIDEFYKGG